MLASIIEAMCAYAYVCMKHTPVKIRGQHPEALSTGLYLFFFKQSLLELNDCHLD